VTDQLVLVSNYFLRCQAFLLVAVGSDIKIIIQEFNLHHCDAQFV